MGIYDNGSVTDQVAQNEQMKRIAERQRIANEQAAAWSQKYHNDMNGLASQFQQREAQRTAELNNLFAAPTVDERAQAVDPVQYERLMQLQEMQGGIGAPAEQGLAEQMGRGR